MTDEDLEKIGIPVKSKQTEYDSYIKQQKEKSLKQFPKREYSKPSAQETYYVFVTENNGQITTTTISEKSLQQERNTLEQEMKSRNIKSYYITKNQKEYENFIKRISQQQQQESRQLRTKLRYPGSKTIKEQAQKGIKEIQKGFVREEKRPIERPRQIHISLGNEPTVRSTFWSPEKRSPLYQEQSSFGKSVLPYQPISWAQTSIKKPLFKPQFVRF